MALKIRRRARLRRKEVSDLVGRLAEEFGMAIPLDDVPIDEAEAGPHRLLLRGEEPIALVVGDTFDASIRRLLDCGGNFRRGADGDTQWDGDKLARLDPFSDAPLLFLLDPSNGGLDLFERDIDAQFVTLSGNSACCRTSISR